MHENLEIKYVPWLKYKLKEREGSDCLRMRTLWNGQLQAPTPRIIANVTASNAERPMWVCYICDSCTSGNIGTHTWVFLSSKWFFTLSIFIVIEFLENSMHSKTMQKYKL